MADEVMDLGADAELDLGTETEVEGAESGAEVEAEPVEGSPEAVSAANTWKQVKERLKDSPDLHRQVKKALHFMEDAQRRMPDGIAKAQERLGLIAQLDDDPEDPEYVAGSTPIEDVISNTLAERGFWRDFDNAFSAGDPKIINTMIEQNPISFQKLVPEAFEQYRNLDPDGYSTLVCRPMANFLQDSQIPLQLMRLEDVLPPNSEDRNLQRVIDAFNAIKGVVESIQVRAKQPIEPKSGPKATETTQPGDNLESREMNVLHDEWLRDIRPRSEAFSVAEVQRTFPGKRFTPAEVSSIQSAIRQEINARVAVNPAYQQKIKSLLKAKNKTAYAMTVESEHKKIIPGAVKRAVDDVLAKRSGQVKKPAVNGSGKPQVTQSVAPGVNNQQFEWIADSPARLGLKIDFRRGGIQPDNSAFIVGRAKPVKWKQKR